MPKFETSQIVNHSADRMFELVADIDKYPEFVPFCQSMEVRGRNTDSEGKTVMIADMTVAYKFIRETFTSRVVFNPGERLIITEYLDGPFRQMENKWRFTDLSDNRSEVYFFISYEFKSRLLNSLMGGMFEKVFQRFAAAFCNRADELYVRSGDSY